MEIGEASAADSCAEIRDPLAGSSGWFNFLAQSAGGV